MSTAPYGTWPSIVSTDLVTTGTVGLSSPTLDGGTLYWLESRPDDGGRVSLWRHTPAGDTQLVVGAPFNVRSGVHEYGGGAYAVRDGVVVFSDLGDHRVRIVVDDEVRALTPADSGLRYADLRVHPDRGIVLAVREDHSGPGEPVNTLVALDLEDVGPGHVLCQGADFCSTPELSADGRLAWTEWNHPDMPWDASRVRAGRLDGARADELVVHDAVDVAGGPGESAGHPQWAADGGLCFVSDRTGWWNLYSWHEGETAPLWPDQAEYALPQWVFGMRPYVVLDSGDLIVTRIAGGAVSAALLDRVSGTLRTLLPAGLSGALTGADGRAAAVVEDADRPGRVAVLDLAVGTWSDVRRAGEEPLPAGWVSLPRPVAWESTVTDLPGTVHGWYYPPTNPTVTAPHDERPPLITLSHGGPTTAARTGFDLSRQYWTSRGFAVLDVDYRGSSGYGRPYRDALHGRWGIVDVADCASGAAALAEQGLADPARLVVRGGSAGGYTTLRALTTTGVFTAGISSYGIGDLETLARDTHKFESRYLDRLIGPYPEAIATYRERSPVHHVDALSVPLLLLHGADDAVVPPNQAEAMAAAVRAKHLPVALVVFDGEGHGFRRAETIKASLEAQLYFLGRVFGFRPADELPGIAIDNLEDRSTT